MNKDKALAIARKEGVSRDRVSNLENTDRWMITHGPDVCFGEFCTVHNRSNHSMRTFPQHFRWDTGVMERTCPHGVGHPDPDGPYEDDEWQWIHGCDGCCMGAYR